MINKELVKQRFGKNLNKYNQNAKIQKQMAEKLFSLLNDEKDYKAVLEIGCGTGLLTKMISDSINFDLYDCIDIVPDCENFIKSINKDINFISEDMEKYINSTEQTYDLIISNASFQWVEDFRVFAQKLIERLNANGTLLFSTFGKENFREIFFMHGKGLSYKSPNQFREIFSEYNPEIEEEIRIMSFNTPKDILKHLKLTGVNGIESKIWTKKDLLEFENGYNNLCSGSPTLTYNPIYVMCKLKN